MRKLAENCREKLFWWMDALKGHPFTNHFREIESQLQGRSEHCSESRERKLVDLLSHATKTVPFYRQLSGKRDLYDFPVVGKSSIRQNLEAFISSSFSQSDAIPTVTSGSTGTPFKVYQHKEKKVRNAADTLYFAQRTGYSIGDRLLYLKIWSGNNRKGRLGELMQNIVPVDVITFNEKEVSQLIQSMERDRSTFAILGYSSAIERICQYLDGAKRGPVQARLSSAISMSETLNDYTRTTIEKYFGVPVYSRYSNLENGILAQRVPGSGHRYLVNTSSYWLEILKTHEDSPAEPGELGRIVVTDFYNRLMPMIRYDTGDMGAYSEQSDSAGNLYLDRIEGRRLDLLYATDGTLVSSYIVYKNMWQYTEIAQYQLIQHGPKDYIFKINMLGPFRREAQLVTEFKEFLGQDANFKVEYVDEIPLLASGKRKKIANTYHPQS
jgi:phenylacetate-CoA ligase